MSEFKNKDSPNQTQTEETRPYSDLQFNIKVQTQTSEGQKMLHIISSLSSTSEHEIIPISHMTEEVAAYGNGLDLALRNISKPNQGTHQTPNLFKAIVLKSILT